MPRRAGRYNPATDSDRNAQTSSTSTTGGMSMPAARCSSVSQSANMPAEAAPDRCGAAGVEVGAGADLHRRAVLVEGLPARVEHPALEQQLPVRPQDGLEEGGAGLGRAYVQVDPLGHAGSFHARRRLYSSARGWRPRTATHVVRSGREGPRMPDKRVVVVAGSGRSGTSTIAGVLKSVGLRIPPPEVPGNRTNPRGFFEPYAASPIGQPGLECDDVYRHFQPFREILTGACVVAR